MATPPSTKLLGILALNVMKRRKLATIFMISTLGIATLTGCHLSDEFPKQKKTEGEIAKSFTVKLPKGAGQIVDAGLYRSGNIGLVEYVVCKNKDGTLTMYTKGLKEEQWIERKYVYDPDEKRLHYPSPYSDEK